MGFGRSSENTLFLCSVGYVQMYTKDKYVFAELTEKGKRFLNQNKIIAAGKSFVARHGDLLRKLADNSEFDNDVE